MYVFIWCSQDKTIISGGFRETDFDCDYDKYNELHGNKSNLNQGLKRFLAVGRQTLKEAQSGCKYVKTLDLLCLYPAAPLRLISRTTDLQLHIKYQKLVNSTPWAQSEVNHSSAWPQNNNVMLGQRCTQDVTSLSVLRLLIYPALPQLWKMSCCSRLCGNGCWFLQVTSDIYNTTEEHLVHLKPGPGEDMFFFLVSR